MPSKDKKTPAPIQAKNPTKPHSPKLATKILQMRVKGLKAVPKALAVVGLTNDQKHKLVQACIYGCSGKTNFAPTDKLDDIAPNISHGVQVCVVDAVHKNILVSGSSTEDGIVAQI